MELKGAIIGFGHIAANGHVPAYKSCKNIRICAVCDKCTDRIKVHRRLLEGSRFYTSVDDLFEKEDLDFVDVATPPGLHAPFIIDALNKGKHVLCEKPLVLTSADLIKIRQVMETKGCCVVTVHNWRYSVIMQEISQVVESKALGNIEEIEYVVTRVQPSIAVGGNGNGGNWRLDPQVAGGGILVDHGWHAFYLVNQWMGQEPVSVECRLENRKFKDMAVEDTAEVFLYYPSGAKARLFFTWAGDKRDNFISIRGDLATLSCPDDKVVVQGNGSSFSKRFKEGLSKGSHHPEWYGGVVDEFLKEIQDPHLFGRNFKEAEACLNILEHCKESDRGKRRVDILSAQKEKP